MSRRIIIQPPHNVNHNDETKNEKGDIDNENIPNFNDIIFNERIPQRKPIIIENDANFCMIDAKDNNSNDRDTQQNNSIQYIIGLCEIISIH